MIGRIVTTTEPYERSVAFSRAVQTATVSMFCGRLQQYDVAYLCGITRYRFPALTTSNRVHQWSSGQGCNASVYVVSVALSRRGALAYPFLPVITAGMMHSRVHC